MSAPHLAWEERGDGLSQRLVQFLAVHKDWLLGLTLDPLLRTEVVHMYLHKQRGWKRLASRSKQAHVPISGAEACYANGRLCDRTCGLDLAC